MKTFNQLIITDRGDLIEGEKAFVETHDAIMRSGSIMTEFAVKLAVSLKTMRDNKLYSVAGFETFEDYTENAVGLKRRQAYNYIKVIEELGEKFVQSTAQIGITKLELLARLNDEERSQITAQTKVEDVSVSELKKQIEQLKKEKAEAFRQLEMDVADEKDKITEELVNDHKESISKLQAQLAEKDKQVQAALNAAAPGPELQSKIDELQAELEELKSRPAEKEIVKELVKDEKTVAKLAAIQEQLASKESVINEKEQELANLKKQLGIANNPALLKFKIKFEEFQVFVQELLSCISELDEEKQGPCKKAFKSFIGGIAI